MKKLLFTLALLCAVVQGTWAQNPEVTFIERTWDATEKKIVETKRTITDYHELYQTGGDNWNMLGSYDDQEDHYYVVKKSNAAYQTLNVFGKAHIILCEGATLRCSGGIKVEKQNNYATLYIHGTGHLVVTNSYSGAAGIGGAEGTTSGDIFIDGGTLNITGGEYAAGIGGAKAASDRESHNSNVWILGGTITTQGGYAGAGIGGGASYYANCNSFGGKVYICDGTVSATGGKYAAGVGGGGSEDGKGSLGGYGAEVEVYGGTLTARGGYFGAGIGYGNNDLENSLTLKQGKLTVHGGTVNAYGGDYGAGIGGGCYASGITVEVLGGSVYAYGGEDAAGIGGGEGGNGCETTIRGGYVKAVGKSYGAGIGGGECCWSIKWNGYGGNTYIYGGTVEAVAGEDCNGWLSGKGSAIGCGEGFSDKDAAWSAKILEFSENMRVAGGDADGAIERVFTSGERVAACRWRSYVKIEECDHQTPTVGSDRMDAVTYTVDADNHTMHCRYCEVVATTAHNYGEENSEPCVCGKMYGGTGDMYTVTVYRATSVTSTDYPWHTTTYIIKDTKLTIPAVSATDGLRLMGYVEVEDNGSVPPGIEMLDSEEETLLKVGDEITVTGNMRLYPRYRLRYVPTWTWDDDYRKATLSITCSATNPAAWIDTKSFNDSEISYAPVTVEPVENRPGSYTNTATATYVRSEGVTYTFTDTYSQVIEVSMSLADAESNEKKIHDYKGRKMNSVTLSGRTLWKDGSWNTLCLPFDVDQLTGTPLEGATLKTLKSTDYSHGTLTLTFEDATSIERGMPYLVKWERPGSYEAYIGTNAASCSDIVEPTFTNVVIRSNEGYKRSDHAFFFGSFSPVALSASDKDVLYLGADNKLYYPSAAVTIGSCRGYFQLRGLTAGDLPQGVRSIVLNFPDDESVAEVKEVIEVIEVKEVKDSSWYSLDGRRLSGKPTEKGIYINNGNKIVIK